MDPLMTRRKPSATPDSAVDQPQERSRASVTSRDVARAAGVSQATVSRAFTPGSPVAPEVRQRILDAAEQIGYRPNLLARSLIAGRSKLIGVVLSRQTNLLYPELLYELSGRLTDLGYQMLLFAVREGESTRQMVERIWSYRVDAVLGTGVLEPEDVELFQERGLPFVGFNRMYDQPVSSVSCDFAAGARDLVRRLAAKGARRFGLICGSIDSYVSGEVEAAVRMALTRIPDAEITLVRGEYTYEAGAALAGELLGAMTPRPDAIICVNDTVAAGCLDHMREDLGMAVPDQATVVAFETFAPSQWRSYAITGVRQPMQEMISAAVQLLMDRIENNNLVVERRSYAPIFVQGRTG